PPTMPARAEPRCPPSLLQPRCNMGERPIACSPRRVYGATREGPAMGHPRPRCVLPTRSPGSVARAGALLAAVVMVAACGGGNGGNGGDGGNGGAAQNAQSCGGTVPDAQVIANWTHRQGAHFAYFIPDPNWIGTESTNSIDISSPTGDAVASYGYAYGPLLPTTLAGAETVIWMGYTSYQIISRSQPFTGGPGQEEILEFTGLWKGNGQQTHAIAVPGVGNQTLQITLIQANVGVWAADECTLILVRNHTTF